MSSQRGNVSKRGQKHQNTHSFVHNKNSKKTEKILSSPNVGLCKGCTDKIEWRKKYRKYKPLTAPKKCAKCSQKTVKLAYHVICEACATANSVCAKCLTPGNTRQYPSQEEQEKAYLEASLEQMRERERRAFFRQLDKDDKPKRTDDDDSGSDSIPDSGSDVEDNEISRTLRAATRRARQLLQQGGPTPSESTAHSTEPQESAGSDDEDGEDDDDDLDDEDDLSGSE